MSYQVNQQNVTTEPLRVNVLEVIGVNCTTIAQGTEIYQRIYPVLSTGNPVVLDFKGVDILTCAFFNFAIGQLLRNLQPDFLNRMLKIEGLNPVGQGTLEATIENASRFYANPKPVQAIGCYGDTCCCHCRYQLSLRCHPHNQAIGKGGWSESMGFICLGLHEGALQDCAVFNDIGHGACELFSPRQAAAPSD